MSDFHLLRPEWMFALIPGVGLLWLLARRAGGESAWRSVCDAHLLERLWLEQPGARARGPLWLLGVGWLLAVVALTGPAWRQAETPLFTLPASRIIVLDMSTSMDAPDPAPSRLARARFKILDILARTPGDRTGLLVFAGEPHLVAPLTEDAATLENLLGALTTDILPTPGDAGAPALRLAVKMLEQTGAPHGEILLITDGLADPAHALTAAANLRRRGHRLSILGVGGSGEPPIGVAGKRGASALSGAMDSQFLAELARAGGGAFRMARADDADLATVLPDAETEGDPDRRESGRAEKWIDEGVWLTPALLLLAVAGFRRGWLGALLVCLLLGPAPAQAFEWADLWLRPDQQGERALNGGDPAVAAARFEDPGWQGMARYQAGDFNGAAEAFSQAEGPEADYNRGNALARAGRIEEAMAAYREALEADPDHADAQANLAQLERLRAEREPPASSDNGPREEPSGEQGQGERGQGDSGSSGAGDDADPEQGPGESGAAGARTGGESGAPTPGASREDNPETGAEGGGQHPEAANANPGDEGEADPANNGGGNNGGGDPSRSGAEAPPAGERGAAGSVGAPDGEDEAGDSPSSSPGEESGSGLKPADAHLASPQEPEGGEAENEDSALAARQDVSTAAENEPAGNGVGLTDEAGADPVGAITSERPGAVGSEDEEIDEADVALEHWLRRIPEDPSGLLRRKFMLERLRRQRGLEERP